MAQLSKITFPAIGAPFGGGFFAGTFLLGDDRYALIVAPKAEGETITKWKTENSATPGARSLRDGLANSDAMANGDHPAAAFCRGLRIGGFDDWYLPSRHEAGLLAENLMPGAGHVPEQTSALAFREGGVEAFGRGGCWTSTEFTSGYACFQSFGYGNQGYGGKGWEFRVRAVRKIKL